MATRISYTKGKRHPVQSRVLMALFYLLFVVGCAHVDANYPDSSGPAKWSREHSWATDFISEIFLAGPLRSIETPAASQLHRRKHR